MGLLVARDEVHVSWALLLMGAYMMVVAPDKFSSHEGCEAAGHEALVAKNTKIVSYACLPLT